MLTVNSVWSFIRHDLPEDRVERQKHFLDLFASGQRGSSMRYEANARQKASGNWKLQKAR